MTNKTRRGWGSMTKKERSVEMKRRQNAAKARRLASEIENKSNSIVQPTQVAWDAAAQEHEQMRRSIRRQTTLDIIYSLLGELR